MSIDIHSEILETRDTRIKLLAEIEVLEEILEQINKMNPREYEYFVQSEIRSYHKMLAMQHAYDESLFDEEPEE